MNLLNLSPRLQIPLMDVLYLESSRNYTFIHLKNGKKILLSKTLGWIVPELPKATFIRVSRCHAINLHYLAGIETKDEHYFALVSGGSQLQISRRRLKQVSDYC